MFLYLKPCNLKISIMKLRTITFLILFVTNASFSQQRQPFSEKTVEIEDRVFLPYSKGTVIKNVNGNHNAACEKIYSIITSWDSIVPPQGMNVLCLASGNTLEFYFLPYLFEKGIRFTSEGGPRLSIHVNDPLKMFGSSIAEGIFLCPRKITDFYGFPIYQNDRMEVTIISNKNLPLFIPVTQEEYLNALITKEEKNVLKSSPSDYQTTLYEMEKAYKLLLETDKQAAKDFKQQMDEFRNEVNTNGGGYIDIVAALKNELTNLSSEEKAKPAYYGGPWAIEKFNNASALVPSDSQVKGEALVKANPALVDVSSINQVQLLVVSWHIDNNQNKDKPRLYSKGRTGFHLADDLMVKLYNNDIIWKNIFNIL